MKTALLTGVALSLIVSSTIAWAKSQEELNRQLLTSIEEHSLAKAKAAIESGAEPDAFDGQTLRSAVNFGEVEIVKFLINHPQFQDVQHQAARALTSMSAVKNAPAIIDLLLTKKPDVNLLNEGGMSPLIQYSWSTQPEVLQRLIELGADVNYQIPANSKTYHSVTALCAVMASGYESHAKIKATEILLKAGAKTDVSCVMDSSRNHASPLAAAYIPKIATLLLDAGADPNYSYDRFGQSETALAVARKDWKIQMLLDRGAKPDAKGAANALRVVAESGNLALARQILGHGVSADGPDVEESPLHIAASKGHFEIVKALLEAGANPNAQIRWNGYSPLMYAVGTNADVSWRPKDVERIKAILIQYGANPELRDYRGHTVEEHWAHRQKYLLQTGK